LRENANTYLSETVLYSSYKEEQTANEYMKCLTSLATGEVQIKTSLRLCLIPVRMASTLYSRDIANGIFQTHLDMAMFIFSTATYKGIL
jgi:hypothetical protein